MIIRRTKFAFDREKGWAQSNSECTFIHSTNEDAQALLELIRWQTRCSRGVTFTRTQQLACPFNYLPGNADWKVFERSRNDLVAFNWNLARSGYGVAPKIQSNAKWPQIYTLIFTINKLMIFLHFSTCQSKMRKDIQPNSTHSFTNTSTQDRGLQVWVRLREWVSDRHLLSSSLSSSLMLSYNDKRKASDASSSIYDSSELSLSLLA